MSLRKQNLVFLVTVSGALALGWIGYLNHKKNFGARDQRGVFLTSIPKREKFATGGNRFMTATTKLPGEQREVVIVNEILKGNVPDYLRRMQSVSFRTKLKDGKFHRVEINVMRDYLAVGSDRDFVRMPMSPVSAQKIADKFHLVLPTPKLVDEIYKSASLKYSPSPLPPGKQMTTSAYYIKHNQLIEKQRKGRNLNQLAGGHKKDVVLTNRLQQRPGKVAIYGWQRAGGKVIQPLSLVHGNYYADYSHGIRLIDPWIKVDGKRRNITAIQSDKLLAPLVSGEGKLVVAQAYRTGSGRMATIKKTKTPAMHVVAMRKGKSGKIKKRS